MEGEYFKELRKWRVRVSNSKRFFVKLKKEFGSKDNKSAKITELKRVEQRNRIIEEFV